MAWASALAIAVLLTLALMCGGCGSLRKTVLSTVKATRAAAEVTRDVCRELAATWCTTNPCPALQQCHTAESALVRGAQALVAGAEAINKMPTEVIDARR